MRKDILPPREKGLVCLKPLNRLPEACLGHQIPYTARSGQLGRKRAEFCVPCKSPFLYSNVAPFSFHLWVVLPFTNS